MIAVTMVTTTWRDAVSQQASVMSVGWDLFGSKGGTMVQYVERWTCDQQVAIITVIIYDSHEPL